MAVKKTIKRTVTTKTGSPKKEKTKSTGSKKGSKAAGRSTQDPAAELNLLLEELSHEEINWLISQARTMIYNHKVEEVNKAAQELAETKKRASAPARQSRKKVEPADSVSIEPTGNGRSFVAILGTKRLFVTLNELKDLVKHAQATDDMAAASKRLFAWMERERRDMVNDAGITGPTDPRLAMMIDILRNQFTVG